MSGEKLAELASVDELELLYLHLQSLHNVTDLANHARPDAGGAQATEAACGMDLKPRQKAASAPKAPRKKGAAKKAGKGNSGNGKGKS